MHGLVIIGVAMLIFIPAQLCAGQDMTQAIKDSLKDSFNKEIRFFFRHVQYIEDIKITWASRPLADNKILLLLSIINEEYDIKDIYDIGNIQAVIYGVLDADYGWVFFGAGETDPVKNLETKSTEEILNRVRYRKPGIIILSQKEPHFSLAFHYFCRKLLNETFNVQRMGP